MLVFELRVPALLEDVGHGNTHNENCCRPSDAVARPRTMSYKDVAVSMAEQRPPGGDADMYGSAEPPSRFLGTATSTYTVTAIHIRVLTAFADVPKNDTMR